MQRTEWPSVHRLAELREQGRFPYSRQASYLFVVAALLIAAAALRSTWSRLLQHYGELFEFGLAAGYSIWSDLLSEFNAILQGVAWTAIVTSILYTLCTSRFLFRLSLVNVDISRCSPVRNEGRPSCIRRMGTALTGWLAALALAAIILWLCAARVIILLNRELSYFISWPGQIFGFGLLLACMVLVCCAAIAWGCAWLAFMSRHKMSLRELREEAAE